MKQIIENLMKHTRHAELDSASQVNPLLSLRDTLPQGRGNTLCAKHTVTNLSTYHLNVLKTDNTHTLSRICKFAYRSLTNSTLSQRERVKCPAFTLAETLITLGIIGVVAAVTIPSLITKYQKQQTVIRLKEAYTLINQAVRLSESDNGEISTWDYQTYSPNNGVKFAEKYFKKYLKMEKVNPYKLKFDGWKSLDGSLNKSMSYEYTRPQFVLYNGVLISFYPNYYSESTNRRKIGVWIFVDINGAKGPNRFGRDVFVMSIFPNRYPGEKVVMGAHDQCGGGDIHRGLTRNSLLNNGCARCNKNYTGLGYGCSYLIQLDGWQISDDYPW